MRAERLAALATATAIVVLALAAGGAPAAAQPAPPITRPGVATTATAAAEGESRSESCPLAGEDAPSRSIVPDDCWGRFPSSHYDIGFDDGAWNDISRKVYGTFTDLAFQATRASIAAALWLVEWAYGFGIYERLGGTAIDLADRYQHNVIGPLGLNELVWFYGIAWAAIAALRGKLAMAAGELAISVVAAGLAAAILANPAGYLVGTFDTMGRLSGAVLATGTGQPPPQNGVDAEAVMRPLQAQIHSAFVEQPYDYLDWGGPLPPPCAAERDRILADGPHGSDDAPRDAMAQAGCQEQADFNHDPNGSRLFGALLTLGAAVLTVALMALVSLTVVVAQVLAIVLFAVAPFALLAAVLPGAGRELAWRWVAALVRVGVAVIGMSLVLSLLLLTVTALLEATSAVGLVERFALLNVVVIAMLVARKRILAAGHNLAAGFGQRLATRRVGGERGAGWLAAPAVAGATGFALGASLGPDRGSRTSRVSSAAGRNYLANRRVARSQHAADARSERRAATTTARHRTDFTVDGEGNPVARSVVTLDGPPPTTRRARAARARLEGHAAEHAAATSRRRRTTVWTAPPANEPLPPVEFHLDPGVDDVAIDAEEA
ncbi:MAG TPA: type IV secretion system protein [Acidimicrobiales bacterium]|nr:type IV secretion system protein [Acidimicrobiales bacterium]